MSGIPVVASEYILGGPVERIIPAGFEVVKDGDLVCKVHNGEIAKAGVAVSLRPSHDGTLVWRAADGLALAWEDEPPTADSHLVIYRRIPEATPGPEGVVLPLPVPASHLPAYEGQEVHFHIGGIAVQAVLKMATLSGSYPGHVCVEVEHPHPALGFYLPLAHEVYVLRPAASAEAVA